RPWRIAATLTVAHVIAVTALGGAVLERYLLPVLPILYAGFAVASRALAGNAKRLAVRGLCGCLIAANFINPPHPFPFRTSLMFVIFTDIVREAALAADRHDGRVTTTFPMTTALAQPNNGYLARPHKVHEIPDFRLKTIAPLKDNPPPMMIVYSTEIDPWH